MPDYLYRNYVKTLSSRLDAQITTIEAGYNFDYGLEFEIVLCELLREVLPEKYGVTRGFVVAADGTIAGDDIIIFDRSLFPTLQLRKQNSFARKEYVPIEAVYCYIEAKHTLNIEGDDGQSFLKASEQVSQVKKLCDTRKKVPLGYLNSHFELGECFSIERSELLPNFLNPVYGVVFSRQVRCKKDSKDLLLDPRQISELLNSAESPETHPPDLMIIGSSNVIVPIILPSGGNSNPIPQPFFLDGTSRYGKQPVDKIAFGIGLISIMNALRFIQLGTLPWEKMMNDALTRGYLPPVSSLDGKNVT
jgi:hypothetical protein